MHRIIKFVEGEIRGLHEAAYLLGAFALLSALLALFRDRLLAAAFGAGPMLDVYYTAFRIPDIVFVTIASVVSVFILVPLLMRFENDEQRHTLIGGVIAAFSISMILITILLWFLMPKLTEIFFPALLAEGDTLVTLSRILLIQPILLGASGILASVTQVHGRYLLFALAPLLYNLSIIAGIIFLYPIFGLEGITYGVVVGAFLHLGIQVPFSFRSGYLRPNTFKINYRQLFEIIRISIPRTLSITANQIALLILVMIAASLGTGAVSIFSLAFNLQAAPLAIIGASYSVAAFPILARYIASGEKKHFCTQIINASRHIIFWALPLITLVTVLRAHIVRVVLGSGAFSWADTRLTAAALALFIISLAAQALSLLFVRGYYAAGETVKPLVVNVTTALGTVGSAYLLIYLFNTHDGWRYFIESLLRVEGIAGTEILMLPLAYAIFSLVNIIVFATLFEHDFGKLRSRLRKTFFESFSAAVVAGFFAHQTLVMLDGVFDIDTFFGVFAVGFIAGIVGILTGALILHMLGNKEMQEVSETMHKRFWRYVPIFSSGTERGTDM